MPLIIQTPKNEHLIKESGTYRRYLNLLDRKETAVQRHISRGGLGSYEPGLQAALMGFCQTLMPDLVFFDVGAHIGIYSALVSAIFGKKGAQVIAFEPTPNTFEICCDMRNSNRLGYVVQRRAVGASVGNADFFLSPKAETSNSLNSSFRPGATSIRVPVTTLDSVVNEGFPVPHLVKIDVETLEPDVLTGFRKTIARYKPVILCEFLPKGSVDEIGEYLSWLHYYGYRFYQITNEPSFTECNVDGALAKIDTRQRNWILAPKRLGPSFYEGRRCWRDAIDICDEKTNKFVERGGFGAELQSALW